MAIAFFCPLGHKLSVPDDRAGEQGRCPVCHQRLLVPQPGPEAAKDPTKDATDTGVPIETDSEVALSAVEFKVGGTESEGLGGAAPEPGTSTERAICPPPIPGQNALAAVASPPPLPPAPPASIRAPVQWLAWQRSDALDGYAVSRPDGRQLEIAYWLASLLPFAAAFCAAPALPHMQFAGEPGWAQLMLSAAILQLAYAAWLALLPDGSTIRVGMYLYAVSAAAYFVAMMAICFLDNSQLSSLELPRRGPAAAWCGLVVVVTLLTGGACRWIARHWRDEVANRAR
jgi:hypothetical protein